MEEVIQAVMNYGVTVVIAAVFIWDWISNKKEMKDSMSTIRETNIMIKDCLEEMKVSNNNITKSLDILQTSVDNQSSKLDRLLDRK